MVQPSKTSAAEILTAAISQLRSHGIQSLTMNVVAEAVGVRTPSLYKHFRDRAAILEAIEITVVDAFSVAVKGDPQHDAKEDLLSMANSYRAFAHAHPHEYAVMFSSDVVWTREIAERRWRALGPALLRLTELVGTEASLVAARSMTAFLHGFVTMENTGAFHLGGNPGVAFETGIRALLEGFAPSISTKRKSVR